MPIVVFDEADRPQPRLDRELGKGYSVSVGRVREDEAGIFDVKFVALSHNSEFHCPDLQIVEKLMLFSCHRSRWLVDTERRGSCPQGLHPVRYVRERARS